MEEGNNEAWNMLLKALDNKESEILNMKKREIELLQKLMKTEENVKGLIKVIAEKQFKKPIENEEPTNEK